MDAETFQKLIQYQEEQIQLFRYHNSRILERPKTKVADIVLLMSIYVLLISLCVILNMTVKAPFMYELLVSIFTYSLLTEFSFRYIGIKVVECYQHYAKEETRRKCLCVPSCSEYSILCFKKYELVYALIKIRNRLFHTCKGSAYIIDYP